MASKFSLQKLFLLVTLSAVIIAGLWYATAEYRSRQAIQSDLFAKGASYVTFGPLGSKGPLNVGFHRSISGDLAKYKRMGTVEFKGYSVTSDCLNRLSALSQVEAVYFITCDLRKSDLQMLKSLRGLELALFWNVNLTDESLEILQQVSGLRAVTFKNTKVTQQGVDRLKAACPEMEVQWFP